jgi:hypothetical protein
MASKSNKQIGSAPVKAPARATEPSEDSDRMEQYTPERIAEFLLNNAVTAEDYAAALEEVRKLGIDPSTIPHEKPSGA